MSKHILITGGAGFLGSHLADELLAQDYRVRALDHLSDQVHGDRERFETVLQSIVGKRLTYDELTGKTE